MHRLGIHNLLRKFNHLIRDIKIANVSKISGFTTYLVRIAQHHCTQAAPECFKGNWPLAVCQHSTTDPYDALSAHGLADYRERLLAGLVTWSYVVSALHIADIDFSARDKAKYINRVPALEWSLSDVSPLILYWEVHVLFDLIATNYILAINRLECSSINEPSLKWVGRFSG